MMTIKSQVAQFAPDNAAHAHLARFALLETLRVTSLTSMFFLSKTGLTWMFCQSKIAVIWMLCQSKIAFIWMFCQSKTRIFLLSAVLLSLSGISLADVLSSDPRFTPAMRRIQSAQGLPSNSIYALAQDHGGYIWFGTERGLMRFDGQHMVELGMPDATARADIPKAAVESLLVDSRNQLWLALSEGGLCVLSASREQSACFSTRAVKERQLLSDSIFAMAEFNGAMWVSEYEHGLLEIDLQTLKLGRREKLATPILVAASATPDTAFFLSQSGELHQLLRNANGSTRLRESALIAPAPASALLVDEQSLWIGTHQSEQLIQIDRTSFWQKRHYLRGIKRIFALVKRTDALAIATERGVSLLDPQTGVSRALPAVSGAANDLPGGGLITSLLHDREGGFWMASTTDGASYWPAGGEDLSWMLRGEGGLPNAQVTTVNQAVDGALWLGLYWRGLLGIYPDGSQIQLTSISEQSGKSNRTDAAGLPHDLVWAVYAQSNSGKAPELSTRIWIGHQMGLSAFDTATRTFTHFAGNGPGQLVDLIRPSERGGVWIASARASVLELDRQMRVLQRLNGNATGGEIEQIEPWQNQLWLAGSDGLQVFSSELKLLAHPLKQSVYAFCRCEHDQRSLIWAVTATELVQLHPLTLAVQRRLPRPGEYVQDIGGIVCDRAQALLLAGPGGMWRVNLETGTTKALYEGSNRPEFAGYPFYEANRTVYIGANRGLLRLALDVVEAPIQLKTNGKAKAGNFELILGERNALAPARLEITDPQAALKFQARALSFIEPSSTRFRFDVLPGLVGEWTERSELSISNLAPGKYVLRAQARLATGEVLPAKQIELLVPTPLTQQRWFTALVSILTLVTCLAVALWLSRQHAQRQARLREAGFQMELSGARTEALARISHEMRNLLNGVTGNTELLRQSQDPMLQLKYSSRISQAGENLANLLDDALDHAKLKLNQLKLQPIAFELEDFFQEIISLASPQIAAQGLNLITVIDVSAYSVCGDRARVRQIIVNLLSNAIKYSKRGQIILRASYHAQEAEYPNCLVVQVQDQGSGIPLEAQARIFEPYTRLHSEARGTGLGLSISAELARLQGGSLHLKTSSEQGSCFELCVPLPRVQADAILSEPELVLPGLDILLIEDEPSNQEIVKTLLESVGHRVQLASDVFTTLSAVSNHSRFDIVLLDLDLESSSGFELVPILRAQPHLKTVPILALSGRAERSDIERCLAAGMQGHIAKPYRLKLIQEKLKEALKL
jgi:signal transduction histidine kinase/CheY-like chemotaxis protein/ligand-binding sensor domain-containing protein